MIYLRMSFRLALVLSCIISMGEIWAQDSQGQPIESNQENNIQLVGTLDRSLPIELNLLEEEGLFSGTISYGANRTSFQIEGKRDSGLISLYEFDENQRVTSIIEGAHLSSDNNWTWKKADHSLQMPLILKKANHSIRQIELYESEESTAQIYLRSDLNQISIDRKGKINHRWIDFVCQKESCYEVKPNLLLTNPIEFQKRKERRQKEIFVYPNTVFAKKASIEYKNVSHSEFCAYYSFSYPYIDKTFDAWMEKTLASEIEGLEHISSTSEEGFYAPSQRFEHRAYGDFYITFLTDDFISGYLMFYGTHTSKMKTIAFNYDRRKNRSFGLKDIFESDFDYPFFLKKFLEKKKRGMILKEPRLIKKMLENERFRHRLLVPEGLIFMTDFNVIFGRRHILVPFNEIESFVGNKSLSSYLKKEKKR